MPSLTAEKFDELLQRKHSGKVQRLSPYNTQRARLEVRCTVCGYEWTTTGNHLLNLNQSCKACKEAAG